VQVKTVESNIAKAKSNIQNASDYLSLLMHQPTGVIYRVNGSESVNPTTESPVQIKESRADFQAMQKAIEASDNMILSSKNHIYPD